jgi:hypothetical protein
MAWSYVTGVTIFTVVLSAHNIFQGTGSRNNQESGSVTGKEKCDRVLEQLYFAADRQLIYKSQILF